MPIRKFQLSLSRNPTGSQLHIAKGIVHIKITTGPHFQPEKLAQFCRSLEDFPHWHRDTSSTGDTLNYSSMNLIV